MGTTGIAVLEQREAIQHGAAGDRTESREHASTAEDARVVERCFDDNEHVARVWPGAG